MKTKVRVTANLTCHGFDEGDILQVQEFLPDGSVFTTPDENEDQWYLSKDEYERI